MATIKISDLSVGDWVEWKVYDKSYDILVTQITDTLIRGVHDGIEYGMLLKQISPIPITPETLEANGWVKDGRSYKWSNEKHRVFVWQKKFSHFVDVVEMDKQFATKSSCIEVSQLYVHQLQHALRLAGVDKEIVMPKK